MLGSLELENYRGFQHYRLAQLKQVNLLVGKNNCGKTSLLEAIHLLAFGGSPSVLSMIAWERGEIILPEGRSEPFPAEARPVISHFFFGHEFGPESSFTIRGDDELNTVCVRVLPDEDSEEQRRVLDEYLESDGLPLALVVSADTKEARGTLFPATYDGVIAPTHYRHGRVSRGELKPETPVEFITPNSLEARSMNGMWSRVVVEGKESEVEDAMRILEPNIKDIFFLSGESTYRILVAVKGKKQRYPLGSYGDGMRRMLALSLALIQSQSGILLIDEIDTGLHYSLLSDMWRLVVQTAIRSNVQVFATTHSQDCVNGLASLCENHPNLGKEVSLQKIDNHLDEAVALDAEQIVAAVRQGVEVR